MLVVVLLLGILLTAGVGLLDAVGGDARQAALRGRLDALLATTRQLARRRGLAMRLHVQGQALLALPAAGGAVTTAGATPPAVSLPELDTRGRQRLAEITLLPDGRVTGSQGEPLARLAVPLPAAGDAPPPLLWLVCAQDSP